jgi:hypothetical protein
MVQKSRLKIDLAQRYAQSAWRRAQKKVKSEWLRAERIKTVKSKVQGA